MMDKIEPDRLVTDEEEHDYVISQGVKRDIKTLRREAQDAKTASIMEAECQAHVERIKREIEESLRITLERDEGSGDWYFEIARETIREHEWQALWEGVK